MESGLRTTLFVSFWLLLGTLACGRADAPAIARADAPSSVVPATLGSPELTARTSGSFVALTYNVAGLPELLSRSRPSEYMPLIGKRLNGYDLVLLQESWQTPDPNPAAPLRCYHELLVATAHHTYKSPPARQPFGDDPRRPSAILADGLNVFSKLPLAATQRVPWKQCVNTMNDCYALKGFSLTPVQLAAGATVHVYNLHMEAGRSEEDDAARDVAIDQLLDFIERHSRGQALIVGGDFNLRGDRERTAGQLAKLRKRAGLLDACASCARPNNIDKLLYRSSEHVQLAADGWSLETAVFQTHAGTPLSDHAPLAVRFAWSKR
ncbi:MAG TPA: endonuclease/exonuclease/phosphatase family protein [Polyangiales bacterium]|nr:endonuclease/exonuclease/phosphatase family protein [Polyangiales bacterium]